MEKKTADAVEPALEPTRVEEHRPFLALGGRTQERYERLRAFALLDLERRPRVSPERFDLQLFQRFGLLGLVEERPAHRSDARFEIQVVPLETDDAADRWTRLCGLLAGLMTETVMGEANATGGAVRAGVDGSAGEGADDPEPARSHHALR